jgi:D-beta-D-heptose 7-phosphate kinase/D-beta-D-heptose 1-phosphate adenosyltransferase
MRGAQSKILTRVQLVEERARLRTEGKTLVFTNGVFDVFHAGHAYYLEIARGFGDALAVGLNSDASVRRYKGDKRPINTENDRSLVLASLESVDYVVVFGEDKPDDLLRAVLPDVLVKGRDWAHYVAGREIVEGAGGRIELADVKEGLSSTSMIERIRIAYGQDE